MTSSSTSPSGTPACWPSRTQALGVFHVLVGDDGEVLGRFNLVGIEDGTADLGYRVAEKAAGRGVATAAVLEVCRLAAAGVRPALDAGGDHP